MKIEIKHRWTLNVIFSAEIAEDVEEKFRVRAALSLAVESGADLCNANLRGANLCGANLCNANLRDANLRDANLCGANLRGANLRGANLRGADLCNANLRDANLRDANLRGANLRGADLCNANLRGANLCGANLRDANLRDAKGIKFATPQESVANLDRVREIILDNAERLEMGHWHEGSEWHDRSCAEEAVCGTTHCLAGWLQVCATDAEVRTMNPYLAGAVCAPVATKMFYEDKDKVIDWLRDRTYVNEAV